MAANKFATVLHKNSNKITLVLVYALLEWVLIAFLLLNSLFSYFIIRFSDFFGLKRPCILCSRVDHVFDPTKTKFSYRDLVCDSHTAEISKLGFCSKHGKLTESIYLCEDCSSLSENGYVGVSCSCCSGKLERICHMGKIDDTHEGNLILHLADDDDGDDDEEERGIETGEKEEIKEDMIVKNEQNLVMVDRSLDHSIFEDDDVLAANPLNHLDFFIDQHDCRLIPVDNLENVAECNILENAKEEKRISIDEDLVFEFDKHVETQVKEEEKVSLLFSGNEMEVETKDEVVKMESSEFIAASVLDSEGDLVIEEFEQISSTQQHWNGEVDVEQSTENQVSEEARDLQNDESEAEVSIGTKIPDQEHIGDVEAQENFTSNGDAEFNGDYEHGSKLADEDDLLEFNTITIQTREQVMFNHLLSFSSEINEDEEDKASDTLSNVDSLHHLHRKLSFLDRREPGAEESLDGGSVLSDIEGDGVLTMEKLKTTLRSERKALNALYAELEEERSASAIAANQTMAMINRLQEEKAAMKMEALHYQRMMEEQAEYDQEALQLLNDLTVKREKEKAELEKELQIYRRKLQEYELGKKDISALSATTCTSCSNADDSDGLSIEFCNDPNTPPDAVLDMDGSLASFEEERMSILDELKVLEEKLFTFDDYDHDNEELHFHDVEAVDGNGYIGHIDYVANGYSKETNGKHYQERRIKAKRLLPLFDAADDTNSEDCLSNGCAEENMKSMLEDEVNHVYERLHALEADRDFLKHCVTSLSKGDKGISLLQQILQHLRGLRSVEGRVRNTENGVLH